MLLDALRNKLSRTPEENLDKIRILSGVLFWLGILKICVIQKI